MAEVPAPPVGALPSAGRSIRVAPWFVADLRQMAAAATAGLVVGFVVNGIGSRLAMMLLAQLNPQATGVRSDDGFTMGQFGLADTAGLVLFATLLGVLGGLLFLVLRPLRFGPRWFRTASMTVGPAVVVGALLVHTDGVDFTILEPTWLAIGLFVALPGLFGFAVSELADRWLEEGSWFVAGRRGWWFGLVPLVIFPPFAVLVLAGLALRAVHQSLPPLRSLLTPRRIALPARVALAAVFALALVDLTSDTITLI